MFGLFINHNAVKQTAQEIAEFALYLRHNLPNNIQDMIAAVTARGIVFDKYALDNAAKYGKFSFNAFNLTWHYGKRRNEPSIGGTGYEELYGLEIQIHLPVTSLPKENDRKVIVSVETPLQVQLGKAKIGRKSKAVYHELLCIPGFWDVEAELKMPIR